MLLFLPFDWPKIKEITIFCSFSYAFMKKNKNKTKELDKEREREIKQLSKQINPTFPRAFDLRQCQFHLFPPFLSLNQYNL